MKIHAPYRVTDAQYAAIALLAPNATVNYVENGKVVQKVRPVLGNHIEDRVECGNDACVTNDPREPITNRHYVNGKRDSVMLQCGYCETVEPLAKVHQDERFIYIKP